MPGYFNHRRKGRAKSLAVKGGRGGGVVCCCGLCLFGDGGKGVGMVREACFPVHCCIIDASKKGEVVKKAKRYYYSMYGEWGRERDKRCPQFSDWPNFFVRNEVSAVVVVMTRVCVWIF